MKTRLNIDRRTGEIREEGNFGSMTLKNSYQRKRRKTPISIKEL
jgi:hypothetical protein